MNMSNMMEKASGLIHKAGFMMKQHSPEILVISGIGLGVFGTVKACKATVKAHEKIQESKELIEGIHQIEADGKDREGNDYDSEQAKRDLATVYLHTGAEMAKLYWPSVTLGAASVTCILSANHILKSRNAALAAAYATIDNSFRGYRSRVAKRWGEEAEREIRYNIVNEEVKETVVDEETGKKKTVKKTVAKCEMQESYCDYMRFFDKETSKAYEPSSSYNDMFLKAQQTLANQRLRAYGYLFLNDVYEALGIEKTQAGQVVGWIYDEENPVGDNYVDFRVMKVMVGDEEKLLIDPNVDGAIVEEAVKRKLMPR